jgi:rhamnosyltransferase
VLVDNSGFAQDELAKLDASRFELILNQSNVGLGNALNAGCERAMALGYKWVVTLDQDTELAPGFVESMLAGWSNANFAVAVLGCNYYNESRSTYRVPPTDLPVVCKQTTVITSGSLVHLPTWHSIGRFRGDYFIDAIDHEFCLRVRQNGFVVAINSQVGMRQHIGEKLTYQRHIARYAPYRHSIWRKYTSTRNTIRTVIDYSLQEPFAAIILLEPDKRPRLLAFFLGLFHGCQGRLGPVPEKLKSL